MIKRGKELSEAWSTFLESPVSLIFAFVVRIFGIVRKFIAGK